MIPILEEVLPGQESAWDYPRPPLLAPCQQAIIVRYNEYVISKTHRSFRVLERSHPPCYYIPIEDINMAYLEKCPGVSYCEWKGECSYYRFRHLDIRIERIGWAYENPKAAYKELSETIAFYPNKVRCFVDGAGVGCQEGHYYGGWITGQVVGPFKGGQGTWSW